MNTTFINDQHQFDDICARLAGEPKLAMDTEFVRRSTYYPILSLVQIATGDEIYLIDPFEITDWSGLTDLFSSDTQVVMHSCSEDLEVFRAAFGALPKRLFDTQIAAAYLGKGDALGYAAMVALIFDQQVDKSQTQSDWTQRPLTPDQLTYAAEDVRWLIEISDLFEGELESKQRADWVTQEIDALKTKYAEQLDTSKTWLRLKGIKRVSKSDWPLAQALCAWREDTAMRLDKPKSWIIKDNELMEIILSQPKSTAELSNLPSIPSVFVRRNGKAVLALLEQASSFTEPEDSPAEELTGSERKTLKSLQKIVAEYSEKNGLAARFIANKQELSNFILFHRDKSSIPSMLDHGWRKAELGEQLLAVI